MQVNANDNRGRWIIIGGAMGATFAANTHHLPVAVALGIAAGMTIGTLINKAAPHGGGK